MDTIMLSTKSIEQLKEEVEKELEIGNLNFPTSFHIIEKLKELTLNDNSTIKDFSSLIQVEPNLLAKVLRLSNSVSRNPSGIITSNPFTAIQRIGLKALSCLVFLSALDGIKNEVKDSDHKHILNMVWKHSIDTGCKAYYIAKYVDNPDKDGAMLSGIMSNIGQFFLMYKAAQFPGIDVLSETFETILDQYDRKVTKEILDIYKLPHDIVESHDIDPTNTNIWPPTKISHIVSLARIMVIQPNPLIVISESVKRKIFLQTIAESDSDLKEYQTMVDMVEAEAFVLFMELCME